MGMIIVYATWWAWTKCKRENRWQNPINLINHQHKLKTLFPCIPPRHTHTYTHIHIHSCIQRRVIVFFVMLVLSLSYLSWPTVWRGKMRTNSIWLKTVSRNENIVSLSLYVFMSLCTFHHFTLTIWGHEKFHTIGWTHVLLLLLHEHSVAVELETFKGDKK